MQTKFMVSRVLVSILVLLKTGTAMAGSVERELQNEFFQRSVKERALTKKKIEICGSDFSALECTSQKNLWLTVLEELAGDGFHDEVGRALLDLDWQSLNTVQKAAYLKLLRKTRPNHFQVEKILEHFSKIEIASDLEMYALCRFVDQQYCTRVSSKFRSFRISEAALRDLYQSWLDLSSFQNGRYAEVPRFYLFCRSKREYPCLLLMKDKAGNPVMNDANQIWSQPLLAFSRHLKEFDEFGGNTPSGIFLIDGVMPQADQPLSFGKFRRMILDFVPSSSNESLQKKLLPSSSHAETWWKEGVIARDLGRSAFRMHGTGTINTDRNSTYYPFYGTSGCIASRENEYDGIDYIDQRHLLDTVMRAMALNPNYSNETLIRAVLYVVNVDDQAKAVTMQDLHDLGVL